MEGHVISQQDRFGLRPHAPGELRSPRAKVALGYGLAVLATLATLLVRLRLEQTLDGQMPLFIFAVPISLAAAFGGLGPGLVATALSAALGVFFLVPPTHAWQIGSAPDEAKAALFLAVGVSISVICEQRLRALARSRAAEQSLTEREAALRASEVRLQGMIMACPFPVMLHAEGEVRMVNEAWTEISGYRIEDIPTLAAWTERAYSPRGPEVMAEIERLYSTSGRIKEGEYEILTAAGERRAWYFESVPLGKDEAGRRLVMSVAADVTELRRLAREREALLESERAARSEAERASLMKDDFLATVSHELRTPLNAILGWAQMIRAPGRSPEQVVRGLEIIERNARLQTQLISDLLDMSRMLSGKLHVEATPVDLGGVIDSVLDSCRKDAAAKGVALRKERVPVTLYAAGDAARLQQVVWNLVSNAIKFTPAGGEVTVSLRERRGRAEIAVRDTGEGIAPEFLPYVFERFRQADPSRTRRHGGLGIGLSIVRQLVEAHGGEVRVESEGLGRGTTFTVALPRHTPESMEDADRTPASPQRDLGGARVLVVDDEADARELLRRVLEDHGARVETAEDAAEAIAAARSDPPPDLLISDIGMPGMDGYAMLQALRAERRDEARLPAIAVTAYARPEDRERAYEAGYQAHVTKPVEPLEVVACAARILSRRHAHSEASPAR